VADGGVTRAASYLVDQMTKAAQATVPLGQVVVVDNDIKTEGTHAVGHILVMAMDDTRPFDDPDVLASAAAARLELFGWSTIVRKEGAYRTVRAHHADHPGFGISVLCKANSPVTHWNGHTPHFPG
jgi:hypothetical protein